MLNDLLEHGPAANAIEVDRCAFNSAFYELGLRWYWSVDAYRGLAAEPCERTRVRHHLVNEHSHLLRAYDAEFLVDAVIRAKQRIHGGLARGASHAMPSFDWSDARRGEVGI